MCDTGRCPSEAGSGCSTSAGDCPDGMLAVLDEFQRLYQERLERINANPAAPCYSKDKMELLEDWIDDLNQQNRTLVETVKELETEASQRCELLESRLVSTTSSTKQYMLQLHQLQRQIQQLVSGRAQAQSRLDEVTALLQDSTDENAQLRQRLELCSCDSRRLPGDTTDRWQHSTGRPSATSGSNAIVPAYSDHVTGVQGDVTGRLHKLESDLEAALHEKDDLQEILGVRQCELEESQQEVARLQAELGRLRVTLGAERGVTSGARRQSEPPAEVHRLQKHCRDLIDQRNAALAQLAEVKVTLMEVMERQARGEDGENTTTAAESATSETETAAEQEVVRKPVEHEARKPPPASVVSRQPLQSTASQRLQNQLEERDQLVAALQAHLASARNEVALKDETLARLESKLETTRQELSGTGERLAGAEGERDALAQQNQILAKQVRELQLRAEEAQAVSRRLESEADLQMAQITDLQERLLAAETSGKQLTASCVEKDVQIGQQWTTISSLKEALLEAKQQLAALQPAPSYLGGLIAGAEALVRNLRSQLHTESQQPQPATVNQRLQQPAASQQQPHQPTTASQQPYQPTTVHQQFRQPATASQQPNQSVAAAPQLQQSVVASQQPQGSTVPSQQLHQPTAESQQLNQLWAVSQQSLEHPTTAPQQPQQPTTSFQQLSQPTAAPQQLQQQSIPAPQQLHQSTTASQQLRQSTIAPQQLIQSTVAPQQLRQTSPSQQLRQPAKDQLAELREQVDKLILEKELQHAMIRDLRSDLAASGDEEGASRRRRRREEQQDEPSRLTEHGSEQQGSDQPDSLSEQVQRLAAEHAECADQRRQLEAGLARAREQLADTLADHEHVHSQADLIVEHVHTWVAEWRAENDRLARRVDQQAETIATLQIENRHLSERLAILVDPVSGSLSGSGTDSLRMAERRAAGWLPEDCGGPDHHHHLPPHLRHTGPPVFHSLQAHRQDGSFHSSAYRQESLPQPLGLGHRPEALSQSLGRRPDSLPQSLRHRPETLPYYMGPRPEAGTGPSKDIVSQDGPLGGAPVRDRAHQRTMPEDPCGARGGPHTQQERAPQPDSPPESGRDAGTAQQTPATSGPCRGERETPQMSDTATGVGSQTS